MASESGAIAAPPPDKQAPPEVAEVMAPTIAAAPAEALPAPKASSSTPIPQQEVGTPDSNRRKGKGKGGPLSPSGSPDDAGMNEAGKGPDGGSDGMEKPSGAPKQPLELKHERLTGTVAKYQPSNGWGFVKSHLFEGELFFRTERIMPEFQGHPLAEGEAVEFDVKADDHGRPHAVALKPVLGRKPYECLGQRHRGYVRRFAERWGFLNAAAFDGDLFVHRDNLLPVPDQMADGQPPLGAGQAVEFDVALDDRGRAVAKQITTRALLRTHDWIGHRLRGYIRSFQGAWGFINSDRFAGDLFVHRDSLLAQYQGAQLAVGTIVEFDVERDQHRRGTKNRLVARHVAVLGPGEPVPQQAVAPYAAVAPQQPMAGAIPPQQPPLMDPYAVAGMPAPQPLSAPYGTLNTQAPNYPPSQTTPMYYQQQGTAPASMAPEAHIGGMGYGPPPYPYQQAQYMQQPMLPPQQTLPPLQQAYAQQQPYPQPYPPQFSQQPMPGPQPVPPMPQMPQMAHMPQQQGVPQQQGYLPPGVTPATSADDQQRAMMQPPVQTVVQGAPVAGVLGPVSEPKVDQPVPNAGGVGAGAAVPVATDGGPQGLLHITMHDWEPDQPGQLWVTKGTLVNVSYRAAHGWVYAGTVQPGNESGEPASEGWIPQAVVKRVSLCRVAIDWPNEGAGTLGVSKGEIIAVSKEAERGWVYGERIGPRSQDRPPDGWLPKKVLDFLQS